MRHAKEARAWIKRNPEAWEFITDQALARFDKDRRVSTKALTELVRAAYPWCNVNNNYTSYFARRLIRDYPRLAKVIELREAA